MIQATNQNSAPALIGHSGLHMVPVDQITPWRAGQMRKIFDPVKLQELADSIEDKGVLQPILLRPLSAPHDDVPLYELVAGERRWRASKMANQSTIPAIVRSLSDKEAIEIQVIENLQRADLSPIEEAEGYKRLLEEHGYTAESLAGKLAKSKSYVYGRLKLCVLPPAAIDAITKGDLPATVGELIGRLPNMEMREQFWSKEFEGYGEKYFEMPSFRDIKETIERQYMRELKSAPFSRKDAKLVPDAGACINCPKMTGNNRAEYPDGRADMCTDVPCFERKLKAHCARQVEKAKDSGAQVLDEAESAKMFQVAGGKAWLSYNAGQKYFPLEDQCWQDKDRRSYKQLIEGHLQPVVAVDPFGTPHFLAPKAETEKVLKEVHKIKSETSRAMSDRRASDRKRQEEKKIRQATAAEIVTRAITDWPFPVLADPAFLRVMATHLISNGGADAARAIAKRREIEYDTNNVRGSVEKIVADLEAEELPALIVECLIQQELDFWAQWGGDRGDKFPLCEYFEMSPKGVMKEASAKLKVEAKQAAKSKKAKPKARAKAAATA